MVVMLLLRNFTDFFSVEWFFIYLQLLPIEDLPIFLVNYDEMAGYLALGCFINSGWWPLTSQYLLQLTLCERAYIPAKL